MPRIAPYIKKFPMQTFWTLLCNILILATSITSFVLTFLTIKEFVMIISTKGDIKYLFLYTGLYVMSMILSSVSLAFFNYTLRAWSAKIAREVKNEIYATISGATHQSITQIERKTLVNLLNENIEYYIMGWYMSRISLLTFLLQMVALFLVFALLVNVYAFIIVLCFTVLELIINIIVYPMMNVLRTKKVKVQDEFSKKFSKLIVNFEVFLFSNKLSYFLSKNNELFDTLAKKYFKYDNGDSVLQIIPFILTTFKFVIFIGIAAWLHSDNLISVEAIITTSTNLGLASFSISYISMGFGMFFYTKEINTKMNVYVSPLVQVVKRTFEAFNKIELINAKLEFDNSVLFDNFNLTINKGDKVHISGVSGSGKSSLIACLMNRKNLSSGELKINDDIIQSNEEIRSIFSYSNNENIIFEGNLTQNISLFDKDVNLEKIEKIMQTLLIDYVEDSTLNIKEMNLSEGQKQRIILARMLYLDNEVFVLDESLANLDKNSFKHLLNLIKEWNKTIICVAHNMPNYMDEEFNKKIKFNKSGIVQIA